MTYKQLVGIDTLAAARKNDPDTSHQAAHHIALALENAEYVRDLLKELDEDENAALIAFRLEKLIAPLLLLSHYANKISHRKHGK